MIKLVFIDIEHGRRAIIASSLARNRWDESGNKSSLQIKAVVPSSYNVNDDMPKLSYLGIDPALVDIVVFEDCYCNGVDIMINLGKGVESVCKSLPGKEIVLNWDLNTCEEDNEFTLEGVERELTHNIHNLFEGGYLAALAGYKHEMEAILDHLPSGVIVHDLVRNINWFNTAAENILGYSREEVIGNDCHDIFPNGFCGGKCEFCEDVEKVAKNLAKTDAMNYVVNTSTREGVPKKIEMFVSPVKDLEENPIGVIACFNDITEVTQLRNAMKRTFSFHGIIGADKSMQEIYSLIRDLAESDCAVLVNGESGTGKELAAGAIHGESGRVGKPFVAVNCGALPEGILESELFGHVKGSFTGAFRDKKGKFELADGGTIFLDEVGELSPIMQVKLLRVLQEKVIEPVGGEQSIKIDVRVISATNRDLKQMVATGEFREDLYYRLCVVPLELPALRERRNDIPLLIRHFIKLFNGQLNREIQDISDQALQVMIDYGWPGNIRELQNAIQYSFVKCKEGVIGLEHLPPEIGQGMVSNNVKKTNAVNGKSRKKRKRKLDRARVVQALKESGGNRSKAAEKLGVGRATLYRYMQDAEIS